MRRSPWAAWTALLLLTLAATTCLHAVRMPAALLLGPMLAAIAITLLRPGLRVPKLATVAAQAVLGCLIASALSPRLLAPLLASWPMLIGVNLLSTVAI